LDDPEICAFRVPSDFTDRPLPFAAPNSHSTGLTRPNGVNTSYSYDPLSRLLAVAHQTSSGSIDGAAYAYDSAGNRTSRTAMPVNLTTNYSYDPAYQLLTAKQGATTKESYTYDAVGNRTYQPGAPYTYNSSNEMLTREGVPYSYDSNGNVLSKTNGSGTTSYAWDFENRLSSVTLPGGGVVSFQYDPLGRRIRKVSPAGSTIYVYDGDNLTEELDTSGNPTERYTYGPGVDEPLVGQRQPKILYYEADGLGSVTSLTDPTGAVAATYTYDSFGFLTNSTGSATNWFRYTARQFDSDTALYYYRARYYDPTTGRFLSEDPIGFNGGGNFYAYVQNRPLNYGDPSGLCPPNACSDPKYAQARQFIKANLGYAQQIASQLKTTAANLLGLSGLESGWGTGFLISAGTNNYFSLTAGKAFGGTIGTYQHGNYTYGVYASPGFLSSGQSFANSYFGTRVTGITDPLAFAEALNAKGSFNSENLATPYAKSVANTINLVNTLVACTQ